MKQIDNDVAKKVDRSLWTDRGILNSELNQFRYPKLLKDWINPIYLSYYLAWNGKQNYKFAKEDGFKNLDGEWDRRGYIEGYDQIDSIGYLFNAWMKYPKYGFQRVTDVCGYLIRSKRMLKSWAKDLIVDHDWKLDKKIWEDFINFCDYTPEEAWKIVKKHDSGFLKEMSYHVV